MYRHTSVGLFDEFNYIAKNVKADFFLQNLQNEAHAYMQQTLPFEVKLGEWKGKVSSEQSKSAVYNFVFCFLFDSIIWDMKCFLVHLP